MVQLLSFLLKSDHQYFQPNELSQIFLHHYNEERFHFLIIFHNDHAYQFFL